MQIRDVIAERQEEDWTRRVRLEEAAVATLVGNIHAAAGNKDAEKAAASVRFLKKPRELPSTSKIMGMLPPDQSGLITPEMIAAEQERLRQAGEL